ncbi:hypothetical protein KIW84_041599 [Lathyrus oleraceus]|uniref:DUF7745 domain-containing protein n=1 Tax=Pisum sativum TaxID=3888 RepID=A0A9D5ARD8_PEA|nr:hypothetical protein KIW84_041599 [Pisum sativum]
MVCGRRNTKKYSFRCPDLKELRKLASFILDPLDFKQHFQLVPTLEEYSHLLGIHVSSRVPFSGLEEIPRSSIIAEALHLKKYEIKAHWVKKGGLFGLPSVFLIKEATTFAQAGSVDAFEAIFVLLIYGLALFPNCKSSDKIRSTGQEIQLCKQASAIPIGAKPYDLDLIANSLNVFSSFFLQNLHRTGIDLCCSNIHKPIGVELKQEIATVEQNRGLLHQAPSMALRLMLRPCGLHLCALMLVICTLVAIVPL